jgi:hypothetical protein
MIPLLIIVRLDFSDRSDMSCSKKFECNVVEVAHDKESSSLIVDILHLTNMDAWPQRSSFLSKDLFSIYSLFEKNPNYLVEASDQCV